MSKLVFRRIRGRIVPIKTRGVMPAKPVTDITEGLAKMKKLRKKTKFKSEPLGQATAEQLKAAFEQMTKLRKGSI